MRIFDVEISSPALYLLRLTTTFQWNLLFFFFWYFLKFLMSSHFWKSVSKSQVCFFLCLPPFLLHCLSERGLSTHLMEILSNACDFCWDCFYFVSKRLLLLLSSYCSKVLAQCHMCFLFVLHLGDEFIKFCFVCAGFICTIFPSFLIFPPKSQTMVFPQNPKFSAVKGLIWGLVWLHSH